MNEKSSHVDSFNQNIIEGIEHARSFGDIASIIGGQLQNERSGDLEVLSSVALIQARKICDERLERLKNSIKPNSNETAQSILKEYKELEDLIKPW